MSGTTMRVRAEMIEPAVYYGDGMHLDGILAFGHYRAMTPEERAALPPIRGPEAVDFPLPLERVEVGDTWVWACSAAHADWLAETTVEVRKRTPTAEMQRWSPDRTVTVNAGPFKPQDKALPGVWAREIVWYARGELDGVRRLLSHVRSVGKLAGHGYGRVRAWNVDPWPHDWSCERDGQLTRRMPAAYRPDDVPGRGGLRAPYHHASRTGPCVEPYFLGLRP